MNKEIKTGFIVPTIEPDHYILGGLSSLPQDIIRVDGDWTPYLPDFESQLQKNFDSDGCTVYGTENALEILVKHNTSKIVNYSKRFIYNVVGITPPGSDPHTVAETIRKDGVVLQSDLLDTTDSLNEFETPRPMTTDLLIKGQQWLNKYAFGHEWLWNTQPDRFTRLTLMKQALLCSPLGISVDGWWQNSDGLYYSPTGLQNGHWCVCYKIDDTGIYVFDSYEGSTSGYLKKLTLDHNIQFSKRYSVGVITQRDSWITQIVKSIGQVLGLIQIEINNLPKKDMHITKFSQKILDWAHGIAKWEGDITGHNAGNLKYTTLTKSWGATQGRQAQDGGYFALFSDDGVPALCNFLTLGCEDELKAFHSARTFQKFTEVYAGNPPQSYISGIAREVPCNLMDDISTFLT